MLSFLLTFLSVISHAMPNDADRPIRCNLAAYQSCIEKNKTGILLAQAKINEANEQFEILSNEHRVFMGEKKSIENALFSLDKNIELLLKEVSFIDDIMKASAPVNDHTFSSHFSFLRKFLFKNMEQEKWEEKFISDRLNQLKEQRNFALGERGIAEQKIAKVTNNISSLSTVLDSINRQISEHENNKKIHTSMCNEGCAKQYCPER